MDEPKSTTSVPLKTSTNNDAAMLRALAADLTGPLSQGGIAQPVLTPEQVAYNAKVMAAEFAKAESVECIPQAAQVAAAGQGRSELIHEPLPVPEPRVERETPVVVTTRPSRLFLTGLPGTAIGKLIQGTDAHVFNLRMLANDSLKATAKLLGNPPADVVTAFRAFGDGQYKPTLETIMMLGLIRQSFPEFGKPAFWISQVLQALEHTIEDGKQVIVVGLRTSHEFKLLLEHGFSHYHCMCTPATAKMREPAGEQVSGLAAALDSDVQKKISVHRNGPRLSVVWTDTTNPPSNRFWNENDFKKDIVGTAPAVVESESIQVL